MDDVGEDFGALFKQGVKEITQFTLVGDEGRVRLQLGATNTVEITAPTLRDRGDRFWQTTNPGFWKLERQQTLKEPGDDGWQAFADGRWDDSLRILDARRPEFQSCYRRIAENGFATRRVRVVEELLTPYL